MHQRVVIGLWHFTGVGDVGELDQIVGEPLAIGFFSGNLALDFFIRHDAAFLHVHDEHASRLQTTFIGHALRFDGQHASLRCHDHEVILRHIIA